MSVDFKYLAGFRLYDPDGLQIQFHIGGDNQDQHVAETLAYLGQLKSLGLSATPPGETPGAQTETIDAYVMGETSKGDACVYLYSGDHRLQFKYATVYVERLGDLPFKPSGRVWPGSAPVRDDAERKGYLVEITAFDIILEPQFNNDGTPRLSDKGKPIYEFARVKGSLVTPQKGDATADANRTASESQNAQQRPAQAASAAEKVTPEDLEKMRADATIAWTTSADAAAWAVSMGAYPDADNAAAAVRHFWNEWGKPAQPELFTKWRQHVSLLLDQKAASTEAKGKGAKK